MPFEDLIDSAVSWLTDTIEGNQVLVFVFIIIYLYVYSKLKTEKGEEE